MTDLNSVRCTATAPLSERPPAGRTGYWWGSGPAELTHALFFPFSLRTEWARATPWCDTMTDLHPEGLRGTRRDRCFYKTPSGHRRRFTLYIIPPPSLPLLLHPPTVGRNRLLCIFTWTVLLPTQGPKHPGLRRGSAPGWSLLLLPLKWNVQNSGPPPSRPGVLQAVMGHECACDLKHVFRSHGANGPALLYVLLPFMFCYLLCSVTFYVLCPWFSSRHLLHLSASCLTTDWRLRVKMAASSWYDRLIYVFGFDQSFTVVTSN